jgi:maltose alpha-D-glucosyltransferase/alpha-amylase
MKNNNRWYMNSVFYEINPRTFYDANGDGIGDFEGIAKKLDYLKSMGVDCIWLMPIYPSPLRDGGYDIADFYDVHPDFGTLSDLKDLVENVHRNDMRIILDLVVNHTSNECEWFKQAESDPDSPFRDYYVWSDTDEKYSGTRIIFLDTEDSNWTWSEKAGMFYWHRFYSHQPDLNYDNPKVRQEMINIMRFWMDLGIDGFRADAVPYLIEREGTNCENLPETHEYLKELRQLMDEEYPEAILLAEANQWPQDLIPYFSDGDEFHMAFHFPIMPRIFKSVALGDNSSLTQTLKDTPVIPDNCQWCTFIRNHDELTLEMVTEEDRQLMWQLYAPEPRMRLNLGIRRRLAPLMEGDIRKIELVYAILFSLPGTPIIYYGDEIGMGDIVQLPDRDGVRTPMQWSAEKNAGFSTADPEKLLLPVIDTGQYRYEKINVQDQLNEDQSLLSRLRSLILIRKAYPVLSTQSYTIKEGAGTGVFILEREGILCLHNLSDESKQIELGEGKYNVLYSSKVDLKSGSSIQKKLILEPYTYAWLIQPGEKPSS